MSFLPRRLGGGGMLALLALLIAPVLLLAQEDVSIRVVGSGIVTPFLEQSGATLDVNVTGTNEGFVRFCRGDGDLAATTRPIGGNEDGDCLRNGVTYFELLVAHNIAAVVTGSDNTFAQCLSSDELNALLAPSSQVTNWNQINAAFPDTAVSLHVPPQDTAAFALLDSAVEGDGLRTDVSAQSVEEILNAVSTTPGALGIVPLPAALAGGVNIVEINGGSAGCAAPSAETLEGRTYTLGQRLFVYVNASNLDKPGMRELLDALLGGDAAANAEALGFTAATADAYTTNSLILAEGRRGREFSADVTGFTILPDVSGTINAGGAAAGASYLAAVTGAFSAEYPGVTSSVNVEGEQAGIRRLCNGELDVITVTGDLTQEQQDNCAANNITTTAVDLGYQAVVLVSNAASPYLTCLSVSEVGAVWSAAATGTLTTWDQVRADFPATPITLFAPSTTSALSDLLLKQTAGANAINRVDIELDDDPLYRAAAVANVEGALTTMTWAEYEQVLENNQANIQLVGVGECAQPSEDLIGSGAYPISQPLRLLVSDVALSRPEVQSFAWYAMSDAQYGLLTEQGLVGVAFDELAEVRQALQDAFLAAQLAAAERLTNTGFLEAQLTPEAELTAQPAPGATEASEPPPAGEGSQPPAESTPPVSESTPPLEPAATQEG